MNDNHESWPLLLHWEREQLNESFQAEWDENERLNTTEGLSKGQWELDDEVWLWHKILNILNNLNNSTFHKPSIIIIKIVKISIWNNFVLQYLWIILKTKSKRLCIGVSLQCYNEKEINSFSLFPFLCFIICISWYISTKSRLNS